MDKSNTTTEQFHRQVFCPALNGSVTRHQWVKGESGGFLFATLHNMYVHLKDKLRYSPSIVVQGLSFIMLLEWLRKSQIRIVSSCEELTIWNSSNCSRNTRPVCSYTNKSSFTAWHVLIIYSRHIFHKHKDLYVIL